MPPETVAQSERQELAALECGGSDLLGEAFTDCCIFYRPTFKKCPAASNEADYFAQADASFAPRSPGETIYHLYVNAPAARIIEAAIRTELGEGPQLGGVTIGATEAAAIEKILRAMITASKET